MQNLNLSNDFLFGNVMLDETICRGFLELITNSSIGELKFDRKQVEINDLKDYRSVRLDVFAQDSEGTIYNIEMQTSNNDDLLKRARFYQAKIDPFLLKKGSDVKYSDLPKSYIIFICTFDYFGQKHFRYSRGRSIDETQEKFDDGSNVIILNTKGEVYSNDLPEDLVAFLKYVDDSSDENAGRLNNEFVNKVHEVVKTVKEQKAKVKQMKTFGEMLDKEREEGIKEAKTEIALNLIKETNFDDKEISTIAGLSIELIQELRSKK